MAKYRWKELPAAVKEGFIGFKTYWNTPKPGNYVPYKEWLYGTLAVGGEESFSTPFKYMAWGANCILLTVIYNIPLTYFAMATLITSPMSYLWSIINNMLIGDNLGFLPRKTARVIASLYIPLFLLGLSMILFFPAAWQETILPGFWKIIGVDLCKNTYIGMRDIFWKTLTLEKWGRFKPAAFYNVLPFLAACALVLFVPYGNYPYGERFWRLNLAYALVAVYTMSGHANRANNVITPKDTERMIILAYPGNIANGINSVMQFMLSAMAVYVNGMDTLGFFKYVLPAAILVSLALYVPGLAKIHERIPAPPIACKPNIDFWYGLDAVLHNKYRWIKMISSLIDNLGTGTLLITNIVYLYVLRETDWLIGLLTIVIATATTPGSLLAPLFNKMDYRKLYFLSRSLDILTNAIAYVALFVGIVEPITFAAIVIASGWFNQLVKYGKTLVERNLDTKLEEYQMWISGERLSNFSAKVFEWFSSPINSLLGFMIPMMYLAIGFNGNMDMLFIDDVRLSILLSGCVITIAGDIASMLPYIAFKYPLEQHRQIIKDLEWRVQAGRDLEPVNEAARQGLDAQSVLRQVIARRENHAEEDQNVSPATMA
ncbi:MAG: hypothetical protein FWC27_05030 [Firmicutes bacterium]|nr:hypothetical protein [Bacillota bacterium]